MLAMSLALRLVFLLALAAGGVPATPPGTPSSSDEYKGTLQQRVKPAENASAEWMQPDVPAAGNALLAGKDGVEEKHIVDGSEDIVYPTNDNISKLSPAVSILNATYVTTAPASPTVTTKSTTTATITQPLKEHGRRPDKERCNSKPRALHPMELKALEIKSPTAQLPVEAVLSKHEPKEMYGRTQKMGSTLPLSENQTVPTCELSTVDPEIAKVVNWMVGEEVKLLEYNINFPEYETNPLLVNMSNNFLSNRWARAFTKHGKTLLTLSFNYVVLSLTMLSFGVDHMDVNLVDKPKGCFGHFTAEQKLHKIMTVVMSDFTDKLDDPQWVDYACHQAIRNDSGGAEFEYQCYERMKNGERVYNANSTSVQWMSFMFVLIRILKVVVFLTGPIVLYSGLKRENYVVKLTEPQIKSVFKTNDDPLWRDYRFHDGKAQKFSKFIHKMETFPAEKPQSVFFSKLMIEVDYHQLVNEKSAPVGLFRFLYTMIILCGIRRWHPFLTCCKKNVCGHWSRCFPCNDPKSPLSFTWNRLFRILGGFLLMVILLVPYYIRVWIYYQFEHANVIARRTAVSDLHLQYPWEHTLLHVLDPTHEVMMGLCIAYATSFILLAVIRHFKANAFERIAMGAIRDMHHVNRMEGVRLLVSHFVLPFDKFGMCGGLLVGIVYWPIALSLCILVNIIYSIPTIYLMGRFLIHTKPRFPYRFSRANTSQPTPDDTKHLLSDGAKSFGDCLMLDKISPIRKEDARQGNCSLCERGSCADDSTSPLQATSHYCLQKLIGLLCLVCVLSVLILLTEVLGFVVEVFVFTLMGAIVNASTASEYVMLGFWILIYSSTCFNNVYKKYMLLNQHVFKTIKKKLESRIKEVTVLRAEKQQNTAFKYFNKEEIDAFRKRENEALEDADFLSVASEIPLREPYGEHLMDNALKYKQRKLNWHVHNLVLFVDHHDTPYIPASLFHKICDIEGPGCPGPVYQSLIEAFKQLLYMISFLLFVLITVMTFGEAYKLSSTNQLLVTLAGGFIPTVVTVVIKPKSAKIDLDSYSFEGKLRKIIYEFDELWPVADLSFKLPEEAKRQEAGVLPDNPDDPAATLLAQQEDLNIATGLPGIDDYNNIPPIDGVPVEPLVAQQIVMTTQTEARLCIRMYRAGSSETLDPLDVDMMFHGKKRRLKVKPEDSDVMDEVSSERDLSEQVPHDNSNV